MKLRFFNDAANSTSQRWYLLQICFSVTKMSVFCMYVLPNTDLKSFTFISLMAFHTSKNKLIHIELSSVIIPHAVFN